MMRAVLLLVTTMLFAAVGAPTAASSSAAPSSADLVHATILADTTAVQAGQPFRIGVLLKIEPQWHVYWQNAGEGGMPTTVTLHLPDGFIATPIQYPVPKRFALPGGLFAYGYENEVLLTASITPPAKIASSKVPITAESNWLVCEKICLLGDAKLNLELPVGDTKRAGHEDLFSEWAARLPTPLGAAKNVASHDVSARPGTVTIRIEWKGEAPADIEWFPPPSDALSFGDVRVDTKGSTTTITASFEQLAGQKVEAKLPDSVVAYRTTSGRAGISVPVQLAGGSRE